MSRKAREPISLPSGVEASLNDSVISIKGPKGILTRKILPEVEVKIDKQEIRVFLTNPNNEKEKAFQGLFWALIFNMVKGVSIGFEKKLEMVGVGFRASVQNAFLDLSIGLSHPTKLLIPSTLQVTVEKNTVISVKGIDKQLVGQFSATIRSKRKPEPYKGKGIRYENEYIRRKAGKTSKK